jgi:RNA polymerase sigma-70 factor (ECF subfamily)
VSAPTLPDIEALYRRRYQRFYRLALALTGAPEHAVDAVQEAFARAIRHRFAFRAESALETWLWRTLVNVCADEHRRRLSLAEPAPETGVDPEEWPEVREAIAALPPRQRLVLFLRHYADLDYEGIASVAGIERGTVAATLHAAHRALEHTMEEVRR